MKWKQKLAECNLTEETISAGLKSKIKDFYTLVEGIEEVEQSIQNPSLNDDVEELQEELEDLETAMENADKQLIRAIEIYDKTFTTTFKYRKTSPTMSARIKGVTITVYPCSNGIWLWAPWCDGADVAKRLRAAVLS